jgi:hypothetical protein
MLNSLVQFDVVLRDEGDGFAGLAGSGCSTDAVNVGFRVCRYVVIDDDVDVGNVQTARSDVGGNLE